MPQLPRLGIGVLSSWPCGLAASRLDAPKGQEQAFGQSCPFHSQQETVVCISGAMAVVVLWSWSDFSSNDKMRSPITVLPPVSPRWLT